MIFFPLLELFPTLRFFPVFYILIFVVLISSSLDLIASNLDICYEKQNIDLFEISYFYLHIYHIGQTVLSLDLIMAFSFSIQRQVRQFTVSSM